MIWWERLHSVVISEIINLNLVTCYTEWELVRQLILLFLQLYCPKSVCFSLSTFQSYPLVCIPLFLWFVVVHSREEQGEMSLYHYVCNIEVMGTFWKCISSEPSLRILIPSSVLYAFIEYVFLTNAKLKGGNDEVSKKLVWIIVFDSRKINTEIFWKL